MTALLLLGGCQGGGSGATSVDGAEAVAGRPVQLFSQPSAEAAGMAAPAAAITDLQRSFDENDLARAVERHRINLKQQVSPYRSFGVDLNSDGVTEALVLLEGGDWCDGTGCTLAIFTSGGVGFRPLATIRRVWAPVVIAAERNNGFSDLVVNTGLAGVREQRVRLRFGASGYPGNAITQTPMPADIEVGGTVVLPKATAPAQELASRVKP